MKQTHDLTGFWRFHEDFDHGEDIGEARLFQNGKNLSGHIVFKEIIPDEPPMYVRVKIKGKIDNTQVTFSESSVVVLSGGADASYEPEERSGLINAMGQIVGSGEDTQGVNGVFVMERIL
jgi:hypothetical protein